MKPGIHDITAEEKEKLDNQKAFLDGLVALSKATGLVIGGCGCCDSPFLSEETPENLEGSRYHLSGLQGEQVVFLNSLEVKCTDWCKERGFKFELLDSHNPGNFSYYDAEGNWQDSGPLVNGGDKGKE